MAQSTLPAFPPFAFPQVHNSQLAALIEASVVLDKILPELSSQPMPIFAKALHARDHVNKQIDELLSEEYVGYLAEGLV